MIEKGIGKLEGDTMRYLNTELRLEDDSPFAFLPYKGREKVLPTEYNGLFLIDTITFQTRKWEIDANELLEEVVK